MIREQTKEYYQHNCGSKQGTDQTEFDQFKKYILHTGTSLSLDDALDLLDVFLGQGLPFTKCGNKSR